MFLAPALIFSSSAGKGSSNNDETFNSFDSRQVAAFARGRHCVVVCVITGPFDLQAAPVGREHIQCLSLEIKTDVGIVFKHLPRDMTSDRHNGRVTSLRLSQLGDRMMPEVGEAQAGDPCCLPKAPPCRTPALLWGRGIEAAILTCGEDLVIRIRAPYRGSPTI